MMTGAAVSRHCFVLRLFCNRLLYSYYRLSHLNPFLTLVLVIVLEEL